MDAKPRLLEQVRCKLCAKHYSYRTELQYVAWIRRFILHHGKRHPQEMSGPEVEQFLTHLAVDRRVAASTQNQALAAVLFLYRQVLEIDLPWLANVVRARRPSESQPHADDRGTRDAASRIHKRTYAKPGYVERPRPVQSHR